MVEEEKLLHWLGLGERRRLYTDKQIRNGNERTVMKDQRRDTHCA